VQIYYISFLDTYYKEAKNEGGVKMKNKNTSDSIKTENGIFNKEDVYGVMKQEIEVDSDVREDRNRERLLDESLSSFIKQAETKEHSIENQ
jgi:hypothetical protein